jgi:hypothetical protein
LPPVVFFTISLIIYKCQKVYFVNQFSIEVSVIGSKIQLAYVLPFDQLELLPSNLREKLIDQYSELYPREYSFKWAFCRYFWEAHPILPEIPLSLLKKIAVVKM